MNEFVSRWCECRTMGLEFNRLIGVRYGIAYFHENIFKNLFGILTKRSKEFLNFLFSLTQQFNSFSKDQIA